jgi:hypothetical protein
LNASLFDSFLEECLQGNHVPSNYLDVLVAERFQAGFEHGEIIFEKQVDWDNSIAPPPPLLAHLQKMRL